MIIDCHTHIGGFGGGAPDFVPPSTKDLIKAMDQDGVDMAFVISNYLTGFGEGATAERVVKEISEFPSRLRAIVHVDLPRLDEEGYLDGVKKFLQEESVVGLKFFLGYQKGDFLDGRLDSVFEECRKLDKPVMFHTGYLFVGVSGGEARPERVAEVAERYPENRFVMAHFGNPWIRESAEILARHKNIFADLSAYFTEFQSVSEQEQREFVEDIKILKETGVGVEKLIFGTDWLLYSFKDYIEAVKALPFSEEEFEGIFHNNARRVFGV